MLVVNIKKKVKNPDSLNDNDCHMKTIGIIAMFLILSISLSGCLDFSSSGSITYESHPTKIQYTIEYGYLVESEGSGSYEITYDCNIPRALFGSTIYTLLFTEDYEPINLVNNSFIRWNLAGIDQASYELGLSVAIEAEALLVTDLEGEKVLTIGEIQETYSDITQNYLNQQSNDTLVLIDPQDSAIQNIANEVKTKVETENSLLLAKALFIWLKENTSYQIHPNQEHVQPASETFLKKTGDCDDLSYLYISLCRAIGIPARFIRGYLLQEENGEVTAAAHAWSEVFVGGTIGNGGWVPVECSCCTTSIDANIHQNFGVESAYHLRLFIDDGSDESLNISQSGISYVYGIEQKITTQSFTTVKNYQEIESHKLVVTKENTRVYE